MGLRHQNAKLMVHVPDTVVAPKSTLHISRLGIAILCGHDRVWCIGGTQQQTAGATPHLIAQVPFILLVHRVNRSGHHRRRTVLTRSGFGCRSGSGQALRQFWPLPENFPQGRRLAPVGQQQGVAFIRIGDAQQGEGGLGQVHIKEFIHFVHTVAHGEAGDDAPAGKGNDDQPDQQALAQRAGTTRRHDSVLAMVYPTPRTVLRVSAPILRRRL